MHGVTAALALYRGGTTILSPFSRLFLNARRRFGKEDCARLGERLGVSQFARPFGPLVWLHGASIGEGRSLLPLIAALRARGLEILLTTGTTSSASVLVDELPLGVIHQFRPMDTPSAIGAFLRHWRPHLLILAESEIWPNILIGCKARAIPVAIANARLSDRSFRRWLKARETARELFNTVVLCTAQSDEDARRFSILGVRDTRVAGNLKYDAAAPRACDLPLAALRAQIGARPVLFAAATQAGEEETILRAHQILRRSRPDLLTIVMPRHVSRSPAVMQLTERFGLRTIARTSGAPVSDDVDVLIADTFGETGVWLRLATLAVIGKTFTEGGGQTPIEAALCGVPILHGPSIRNFAEIFSALDRTGGALNIDDHALADSVSDLLRDASKRDAMGLAARETVEALKGATARTLDALSPLLTSALETALP